MTTQDCMNLKNKINAELQRRNGYGDVSGFASGSYNFSVTPTNGQKTYVDTGRKTIDTFLQIEDYKDLKLTQENQPIPNAFCMSKLGSEVDRLSTEQKTGESQKTRDLFGDGRSPEHSSCRGNCTGLCVGTCIGNCNGCTGCTMNCGTSCQNGCRGCNAQCENTCLGCRGCNTQCEGCTGCMGCNSSCQNNCYGCTSCSSCAGCTGSRG